MPEFLSPGVFIEEVPAQLNAVQAASTSTGGGAGFTYRGPADEATLVTSLDQYQRVFGPLAPQSLLGLSMAAFFNNGGRRAYVVRVVPADAVASDCRIQNSYSDEQIEVGDGTAVTFTRTNLTTLLKANQAPLKPGYTPPGGAFVPGLSLRYRKAGSAVVAAATVQRDGTSPLVGVTAQASYEGKLPRYASVIIPGSASPDGDVRFTARAAGPSAVTITVVDPGAAGPLSIAVLGNAITITLANDAVPSIISTASQIAAAIALDTAANALVQATALGTGLGLGAAAALTALVGGLPTFDDELDSVVRGTVSVTFTGGGAPHILAFPVGTSHIVTTTVGSAPNAASGTLDTRTGVFSFKATGTFVPAAPDNGIAVTASYTPATESLAVVDDGAGNLSGAEVASGTINYLTGAYTFTLTPGNGPHNLARILAAYTNNAWNLVPVSKGEWGDDLQVQAYGHPDYYTPATASYSRWNVIVRMWNTNTSAYEVVEQFEEVDFTDVTSAQYFADVINELSDYVRIVEPGSDYAPTALAGKQKLLVAAGGDELAPGKTVQVTLTGVPISPRSVSITWTDPTGTSHTIVDNGSGFLVNGPSSPGAVDGSGLNTISYTLGTVDVKLGFAIQGGSVVQIAYCTNPASDVIETFGDEDKRYTYSGTTYYRAGTNGTFDDVNWGRNQFTNSALLTASKKGIFAFDAVEEILQMFLPDFAGDEVSTGDLLDYATTRAALPHGGDRFIILATPVGCNPQEAVDWFRYTLGRFSDYAALYWPWVKVQDPISNRPKLMPPLGHVAGIYARTDATRNVAKAPAGTVDGQLNFLTGLEYISSHGERDLLVPNKVNPLVSGTNTGLAVWGARTISAQSAWKFVSVRRLFMFLEKSVFNSTFWAVFEPNGPGLWSKISLQLSSWLLGLYNGQYFAGTSPAQAFFVICDSSNNDSSSIEAGQVICDVGVAPSKPAEFIRFRFAQKTL